MSSVTTKRQRIDNNTTSRILLLPNDLYISIWHYCTTTLLLQTCLVVNQHWKQLICCSSEVLWRTRDLCIRTLEQAEFFVAMDVAKYAWRLKHNHRFVWELTERYVEEQNNDRFNVQMVKFCQLAVKLTHVTLDNTPHLCIDPFLQLPRLQSLTLKHNFPFEFMLCTCNAHMHPIIITSITELRFGNYIHCPPWLIRACPNLTHLQIHDPDSDQGQAIGNLLHLHTVHLKSSFRFYEQEWLNEEPPEKLDDNLVTLLNISRAARLHTIDWEFTGMELLIYKTHWAAVDQVFLQLSSSLQILNLDLVRNTGNREYLTLHSLLASITQCKALVHLSINDCGGNVFNKTVTDIYLDMILSVPTLITFKLRGVALSIAWLRHLAHQFPSLTELLVQLQWSFQDADQLSNTLSRWKHLDRCRLTSRGIVQVLTGSLGAYLHTIKPKNAQHLILPGMNQYKYTFGWR